MWNKTFDAKLFVFVMVSYFRLSWCLVNETEMTRIVRSMMKDYDRRSIPIRNSKPLEISFRIFINNMVPRKSLPMHYHMDFFVTLYWVDYRMAYNVTNVAYLPFDGSFLDKIWTPNLYLVESKFGYNNDIPQPNVMVFVFPNGTIGFNFRLSVDLYCPMELFYFPFDIQNCKMSTETYSYNTNYVRLKWKLLEKTPNIPLSDFKSVEFQTILVPEKDYGFIGKWDQLHLNFKFFRNYKTYLVRDFFPCCLIVGLSWVNFWVTHRSTPARVALGITTVLTIVTMTNSIRSTIPASNSFRMIDTYLLICNLFVFAALGEAALVGMTAPSKKYANKKQKQDKEDYGDAEPNKEKKKQRVNPGYLNPTFNNDQINSNDNINDNNNINNNTNNNNNNTNNDTTNGNSNDNINGNNNNNTNTASQLVQRNGIGLKKVYLRKPFSRKSPSHEIKQSKATKSFNPLLTDIKKIGLIYFYTKDAHIVDKISRVLFPFSFFLFNLLFFLAVHVAETETVI